MKHNHKRKSGGGGRQGVGFFVVVRIVVGFLFFVWSLLPRRPPAVLFDYIRE